MKQIFEIYGKSTEINMNLNISQIFVDLLTLVVDKGNDPVIEEIAHQQEILYKKLLSEVFSRFYP